MLKGTTIISLPSIFDLLSLLFYLDFKDSNSPLKKLINKRLIFSVLHYFSFLLCLLT